MFETGRIDERTFMRSVCQEVDILPFDNIEEFEELWGNIFTDAGMSATLALIRPSMKVGILSNTDPIHWKYIQRLTVTKAHFSTSPFLTTSFEMKVRKPDEKMYAAAEKFGCEPREILFLDDLQANVDAAISYGFHAKRFNANDVSAVENLRHILNTYGFLQ